MTLLAALLCAAQKAQDKQPPEQTGASAPSPAADAQPPVAEPEEEDAADKPKTYDFNPIEADKDILAGKYYLKKGSLKAALGRFTDASLYNPQSAEAFLLVGETREKLKDKKGAKAAYAKYLELAPKAKNAAEVRQRIEKLH